jgi:hypothetical protein
MNSFSDDIFKNKSSYFKKLKLLNMFLILIQYVD